MEIHLRFIFGWVYKFKMRMRNNKWILAGIGMWMLFHACTSGSGTHISDDEPSETDSVASSTPAPAESVSTGSSEFDVWMNQFKADLKSENGWLKYFEFPIAQAGFTNNMVTDKEFIGNHTIDMWRDGLSQPQGVNIQTYDGVYLHSFLYENIGAMLKDTANVRVIEIKPQPIGYLIYVRKNGDAWKVVGYEDLLIAD